MKATAERVRALMAAEERRERRVDKAIGKLYHRALLEMRRQIGIVEMEQELVRAEHEDGAIDDATATERAFRLWEEFGRQCDEIAWFEVEMLAYQRRVRTVPPQLACGDAFYELAKLLASEWDMAKVLHTEEENR